MQKEPLIEALRERCPAQSIDRLEQTIAGLEKEFVQRQFYFAFSGASRHFDKRDIIDGIAADQVARKALLLALSEQPRDTYLATLEKLLGSADIREAVILYSTFPELPHPEDLLPHAREATRSNVVDIFDAIALDNPFPAEHFPEEAWNQMVLKAIFISRPLHRIRGIEARANPTLALAISNLAHERWAAGREISAEAWHSCQAHLGIDQVLEDIQSLAARSEPEKQALALVSTHGDNVGKLASVREAINPYLKEIQDGHLTWISLGTRIPKS